MLLHSAHICSQCWEGHQHNMAAIEDAVGIHNYRDLSREDSDSRYEPAGHVGVTTTSPTHGGLLVLPTIHPTFQVICGGK